MNRRDGLADISRHLLHKLAAAVNECDITLFGSKRAHTPVFVRRPAKQHIKQHKCDQYDKMTSNTK